MHAIRWLRAHDRGFGALRRAARAAIVMPALFAFGDQVLGDPTVATFAAFGSFAMLLLVDFGGPMRDRLQAQTGLAIVGAVFVCVGTVAAQSAWSAAVAMAVVGFGVLFAGVVSSVLAGATTSLLLAFILPVTFPGPMSSLPDRLAGWGLASVISLLAIAVLWPAPARDPLRAPAVVACRALAARLRADVAYLLGRDDAPTEGERLDADTRADEAVAELRRTFTSTPYRPTGLSTSARTIVRLVDELSWFGVILEQSPMHGRGMGIITPACAVRSAAATLLDASADLLERPDIDPRSVTDALAALRRALDALESAATVELPVRHRPATPAGRDPAGVPGADPMVEEFISSLDPSFRAQELSFAVSQVATNIMLAAAADQRSWRDQLLGRQPKGVGGLLAAAQERAAAHVERHSVWLHNSLRGAAGLALAVLVADLSGVQHSFWVVLGTLSVLRSNAVNTGQNIVRGLLGTVGGFVFGALLLAAIGTHVTLLWILLPPAILVAGIAPAAISFATGQGAFTLTLVILYNIIAPAGWRIGLVRIEDIALGCVVSLTVGVLFWPRGAAAALGRALAEAYSDTAAYLSEAVELGLSRCGGGRPGSASPASTQAAAIRAAAASRRLDDTFRSYLAERGAKPLALARVSALVTGVVGVRLAADAVLDLWDRDDGRDSGDRAAASAELRRTSGLIQGWYDDLAASLLGDGTRPEPLPHDLAADGRLLDAVRRDLQRDDLPASATAARMIWTGDHLDAVRRLQGTLVTTE